MERQQELKQLLHDAKKIIVDFYDEQVVMDNKIVRDVIVDEENLTLTTIDKCDLRRPYPIYEISSALSSEMEGFAMFSPGFYEAYDKCIDELQYKYEIMDIETFVKYAGRLEYMKYRCEELFKKLKMVEAEACFV